MQEPDRNHISLDERQRRSGESGNMAGNVGSHDLPWYQQELGSRPKPSTWKIFESYSGLAPEHVEPHLYAFVCSSMPI